MLSRKIFMILIDIFVYDAIPDVEDIQWRLTLRKAILLRKIMDVRVCNIELNLHFRSFVKYIVQKILRTGLKSLSMFKAYESLFKRYRIQDHRRMSYHAFSPTFAYLYIFQKEWYAQTIMLPFENKTSTIVLVSSTILISSNENHSFCSIFKPFIVTIINITVI